jgi:hypothetical protein
MNDDVSALRAIMPAYAGYGDATARRLSDQQVRAWAGEVLIGLQERLAIDPLPEGFERLLMRCEFGDQHVIKALEADDFGVPGVAAAIEAEDRKVIAATAPVGPVPAGEVDAFVAALELALDERDELVMTQLKR